MKYGNISQYRFHSQYPPLFRTELQIILDNITILLSYYCCLYYDNYLKILGYGSSFTNLSLTELVTTGLGLVG